MLFLLCFLQYIPKNEFSFERMLYEQGVLLTAVNMITAASIRVRQGSVVHVYS